MSLYWEDKGIITEHWHAYCDLYNWEDRLGVPIVLSIGKTRGYLQSAGTAVISIGKTGG